MNRHDRRSSLIACAAALTLLAAGVSRAPAQDAPLTGQVDKGVARIKIAIPDADGAGQGGEIAREIVQTVREDLEFSGYFDVVDPNLYRLVTGAGPTDPRHEDWLSIGADTVALTRIDVRGDRVDLEARLYQNESRTALLGQRYGGTAELRRLIGHQLADDIIRVQTGQKGVASTRIAFVSSHGKDKEIYLMDYDGRRVRRLTTSHTINLSPVWSPTGDELAYVSWKGRQPGVYAMSAEGVLRSLATVGGELSSSPDWSQDGTRLAYSSDEPGNTEIFVLDRRTGRNTRLTRHPAIDTAPSFAPNGREIAFTSDRTGAPQIYLMDAEGLNVRRISWSGNYNDSAAWSPRGDRLAFVSRDEGRFDIMLWEAATEKTTRLTRGAGNNENPAWSPDGRHLVFASDRAGTYDIYTMSADGGNVRRLTRNGDCYTPHWSP